MNKILILKDNALAATDELFKILQNYQDADIIELSTQNLSLMIHDVDARNHQAVLIALGCNGNLAWQISSQINFLKAVIIIYPQELKDYLTTPQLHPCMMIHHLQNSFITPQQLTLISRPRPDVAQFITSSNSLMEFQQEILTFIKQYLHKDKQDYLARIIRSTDIAKMLPAPNPGAIRVLEENYITIGMVVPDKNPPFEHVNPGFKNEIHFVISGTANFQHGNSEKVRVQIGDFVYVNAFEKHLWTDWTDDFKLLFIQWEIEL